jgi:transformation/transcription domain-associated protein
MQQSGNSPMLEAQFQGILLVRTLVKFIPPWLSQNRLVMECLIDIWQSPARIARLASMTDETISLHYLNESKHLVKCFLNYCSYHREEVDVLFFMLSIFTTRTTIDFTFLRDFYSQVVAEEYSQEEKKAILHKFLHFFKEPSFTQEHKVQALQVLVIPMLKASFLQNEFKEAIDSKVLLNSLDLKTLQIVGAIIGEILDPKPGEVYEEALNIELLQLAALLVRFMPAELVEHRKELIKFAWNHLKSEDMTTRQCAYVLVCRFIEAYETPPKIVLQVYVALLRAFQVSSTVFCQNLRLRSLKRGR